LKNIFIKLLIRIIGFLRFLHICNLDAQEIKEKHNNYTNIDNEYKLYMKFIFFIKFISFSFMFIVTLFGSIEGYYAYRSYKDKNNFIDTSNKVAKSTYYLDNSPKIAMEILNKAEELDNVNVEIKKNKVFIESMSIADKLLDIDRLYTKDELNDAKKALANCEFLIQNNDKEYLADGYFAKSQIYLALKDYDRAQDYIQKAFKYSQDDISKIYYEIREATIKIQRYQDNDIDLKNKYHYLESAKEILNRSIFRLEPIKGQDDKAKIFLMQAHNWLGLVYSEEDNKTKSKKEFEKALSIDNRFSDALYNLAETNIYDMNSFSLKDEILKNEEDILKLLKINPDNKDAYWLWGYMYGKIDKYKIANGYFDKALEIDSKYFNALLWKGIVLYEDKRYKDSLLVLNEAIKLDPKSDKARYRRGIVNSFLGLVDESNNDYDYVLYYSVNDKLKYKTNLKKAELLLKNKNVQKEDIKILIEEAQRYREDNNYKKNNGLFWLIKYDYSCLLNEKQSKYTCKKVLQKLLKTKDIKTKALRKKIKQRLKI